MGKIIDLTGQKFENLMVLSPSRTKTNRFGWLCKCDCGNEIVVQTSNLKNGRTTSCGCLTSKKIGEKISKNLIGKRFNNLVVLEKTEKRCSGAVVWKCICDCGKEVYIPTGNLTSGHTKSCGCLNTSSKNIKDYLGQKFGKLTVIKFLRTENQESIWLCKCECGRECEAIGWHLSTGIKKSCGCLISYGETIIQKILEENNISFEKEKTFDSCRFEDTGAKARFDFYVENKYLIEFDGEQHFKTRECGWSTKENLIKTQEHDNYKTKWCKENNIPLIRIPYTKLKTLTLEDLLYKKEI